MRVVHGTVLPPARPSAALRTAFVAGAALLLATCTGDAVGPVSPLELAPSFDVTGDVTPPVLTAFSATPTLVDISDGIATVTVTASITDDLSGMKFASVHIRLPGVDGLIDSCLLTPDQGLVSGDAMSGTWECTLEVPRYHANGEYPLYIVVHDNLGNSTDYAGPNTSFYFNPGPPDHLLADYGFTDHITVTGTADVTPPVLTAFSATPTDVDVSDGPATVTVTASITDDLSGVKFASIHIRLPGVDGLIDSCLLTPDQFLVSGDAMNGTWACDLEVPQYTEGGTYPLFIVVHDSLGNSTDYAGPDTYFYFNPGPPDHLLSDSGFTDQINVTGVEDVTPPVLTAFSATPTEVDASNGSATVTVTASITDDLSGMKFASIHLRLPGVDGLIDSCLLTPDQFLVSGDAMNGTWACDLTVPQYTDGGTYPLFIVIHDNLGNSTDYAGPNTSFYFNPGPPDHLLADYGFTDQIAVTGTADVTPPVLTAFSATPTQVDVSGGPAVITATVGVSEDLSGLRSIAVQIRKPNVEGMVDHCYIEPPFHRVSGDTRDGTWSCTMEIPQYYPSDDYPLYVSMADSAGNSTDYGGSAVYLQFHIGGKPKHWLADYGFVDEVHVGSFGPNTAPDASLALGGCDPLEGLPSCLVGTGTDADGGDQDALTYEWNFGDGDVTAPLVGATQPGHVYDDDGTYTVTLTVTDPKGASATATLDVVVGNAPPEVHLPDFATIPHAHPDRVFTLDASFSDSGTLDGGTDGWGWNVSWGDGSTDLGAVSSSSAPITVDHAYVDPGDYVVTLAVTDKDGGQGTARQIVSVTDATPEAVLQLNGCPYPFVEGGPTCLNAGPTVDGDDDVSTLRFTWSFGDLSSSVTGLGLLGPHHTYADNGIYAAHVQVTDHLGGSGEASLPVEVLNLPPVVDAGDDRVVDAGSPVELMVHFTDAGVLDAPWTWEVQWGEGAPSGGTVDNQGVPVGTTHSYAAGGLHVVHACVTDKDGDQGCDDVQIDVQVLDDTGPVVTYVLSGPPEAGGWYSGPVTVEWTVADPESPWDAGTCVSTTASDDGPDQSFTCTATSLGGETTVTTEPFGIDQTPPVVTYGDHPGTYDIGDLVDITCTAADELSGVAATDCVAVAGEAWTFGPGSHSFSSSATDPAGNVGYGSTAFSVGVSSDGLCALVRRWVTGGGVANSMCAKLDAAKRAFDRGNSKAAAGSLKAFVQEVRAQTGKAVPDDKALHLIGLAEDLGG